jgi:FkbH-like protein
MNFIEAKNLIANSVVNSDLKLAIITSHTIDPLKIYLEAFCVKREKRLNLTTLSFGTLRQFVFNDEKSDVENEIFLLLPWDIVPEVDWRNGYSRGNTLFEEVIENGNLLVNSLIKRKAKYLYLDAPFLDVFMSKNLNNKLRMYLNSAVLSLDCVILNNSFFGLTNYLYSGFPYNSNSLSELAEVISDEIFEQSNTSYKVLITDLDNVFWSGLIAEDGQSGISCSNKGRGYKFFIYQSLLLKFKQNGILIAAVSRNDEKVALEPIIDGNTLFCKDDFVGFWANYEAKSKNIYRLSKSLNLGLNSFVFIDDNPVEIAEVRSTLPDVTCIQFPEKDHDFDNFVSKLLKLFSKDIITEEDKVRTELYRQRVFFEDSITNYSSGDLSMYLSSLDMQLNIMDRTENLNERVVQLINKTNQFNLNGIRFTTSDVDSILKEGGKLFSAELIDKYANHGEIIACLIDSDLKIKSFVMSCRVFQRDVEKKFLQWLLGKFKVDLNLVYVRTEKNLPMRNFLESDIFQNQADQTFILRYDSFDGLDLDFIRINEK